MLKNILKLDGAHKLSKDEQKSTLGGGGNLKCPTYPPSQCISCGGWSLPNGCCLGTQETHCCLTGTACP